MGSTNVAYSRALLNRHAFALCHEVSRGRQARSEEAWPIGGSMRQHDPFTIPANEHLAHDAGNLNSWENVTVCARSSHPTQAVDPAREAGRSACLRSACDGRNVGSEGRRLPALIFQPAFPVIDIARKLLIQRGLPQDELARQVRQLCQFLFIADLPWCDQSHPHGPGEAFPLPGEAHFLVDAFFHEPNLDLQELVGILSLRCRRVAAGVAGHLLARSRLAHTFVVRGAAFREPVIAGVLACFFLG